jgi:hypothetical protein
MRYTVKTLDDVRKVLVGCPDETPVEVERGRNFARFPFGRPAIGSWMFASTPTIDLAR